MGSVWLPIEAYEGLSESQAKLPFYGFVLISLVVGAGYFLIDGYYIAGHLRNKVSIVTTGFDTKISIEFGDFFEKDGWKAIAVNNFFDSIVDENLVSSRSLHGQVINKFWRGQSDEWQRQVDVSLGQETSIQASRVRGNDKCYEIGTTAAATIDGQKFLFVALSTTNLSSNVASADAEGLIAATRGLLAKARIVCANETLYIPLMGSGLSRIGIKNTILIDLMLAGIFEETKVSKVTGSVVIILNRGLRSEINISNLAKNWN